MLNKEKIQVIDYDTQWASQFDLLQSALLNRLENDIISIEHVGSTSVKGLKAKAIIDLDIIYDDAKNNLNSILQKLQDLGYKHEGDYGITGREAFSRIDSSSSQYPLIIQTCKHHLYVCEKSNTALLNHLSLRNYLRLNPEKVIEYGALKQALAKKHPYNIDAYIDGKTDFILTILAKTGMDKQAIKEIEQQNKQEE